MGEAKRILVLAATAHYADRLRHAAEKLALEVILGCSDETGSLRLDFTTRDSALHIVEFAQHTPVAAIVPVGDETAPSAARAASMIGLHFHPPKAADACANKRLVLGKLQDFASKVEELGAIDFTLECLMAAGQLRVLAVANQSSTPASFATLAPDFQAQAIALLKRLISALGLKHGPVRVDLSTKSGSLSITNTSLCFAQTPITDALRFRIPLVDQEISYAEVVIRNALDLDTSRIHLDLT